MERKQAIMLLQALYHKWLWRKKSWTKLWYWIKDQPEVLIEWIILRANLSALLFSRCWHKTRHNCLTQDITDMSDTCKGCEKMSIFALKRHQRAELAWHQRITAQLCLSELGSPWPSSPLNDCEECPLWMTAILHLMLAGDMRVSECQEEKLTPPPPTCRGPWYRFRTKAWPAVDTHTARAVADGPDLISVSHEIGNYQG